MFTAERDEPYYPKDDQPLVAFTLPHEEMVRRFGPAHRSMDERDNEPGPCEYWSFRFPCGLSLFIAYHFHCPPAPGGNICASSPDICHILDHLPIEDCVFWRLDEAEPALFNQKYGKQVGHCSAV